MFTFVDKSNDTELGFVWTVKIVKKILKEHETCEDKNTKNFGLSLRPYLH